MAFNLASSRRRARNGRTPLAEINVTPLVDVMLVLLIIFMVTAPLLKAGVPIDLPDSRAKALSEKADQLTISVARDGSLYLDQDRVTRRGLAERLEVIEPGEDGKLPLVTLRADKSLDYGVVVAVMGELNRAGFNAISLVTAATGVDPALTAGSGAAE